MDLCTKACCALAVAWMQAALCVLSLRHLSGLSQLQELVLRPRAYTQ